MRLRRRRIQTVVSGRSSIGGTKGQINFAAVTSSSVLLRKVKEKYFWSQVSDALENWMSSSTVESAKRWDLGYDQQDTSPWNCRWPHDCAPLACIPPCARTLEERFPALLGGGRASTGQVV